MEEYKILPKDSNIIFTGVGAAAKLATILNLMIEKEGRNNYLTCYYSNSILALGGVPFFTKEDLNFIYKDKVSFSLMEFSGFDSSTGVKDTLSGLAFCLTFIGALSGVGSLLGFMTLLKIIVLPYIQNYIKKEKLEKLFELLISDGIIESKLEDYISYSGGAMAPKVIDKKIDVGRVKKEKIKELYPLRFGAVELNLELASYIQLKFYKEIEGFVFKEVHNGKNKVTLIVIKEYEKSQYMASEDIIHRDKTSISYFKNSNNEIHYKRISVVIVIEIENNKIVNTTFSKETSVTAKDYKKIIKTKELFIDKEDKYFDLSSEIKELGNNLLKLLQIFNNIQENFDVLDLKGYYLNKNDKDARPVINPKLSTIQKEAVLMHMTETVIKEMEIKPHFYFQFVDDNTGYINQNKLNYPAVASLLQTIFYRV